MKTIKIECWKRRVEDDATAAAGGVVVKKINTEYVYPGIPERCWDWRATFEGYEPGDYMGHGRTEEEAIADLKSWADDMGEDE